MYETNNSEEAWLTEEKVEQIACMLLALGILFKVIFWVDPFSWIADLIIDPGDAFDHVFDALSAPHDDSSGFLLPSWRKEEDR